MIIGGSEFFFCKNSFLTLLQFRIIKKGYELRKYLPKQMVSAVRWESSMSSMFRSDPNDILPSVYECGPGRGLTAMLNKIHGKAGKKCRYIEV